MCVANVIGSIAQYLTEVKIPLYTSRVQAGFPSPADDHIEEPIDLNTLLIHDKESTYIVEVEGDSMEGANITSRSRLVVDKSLIPENGDIIVAVVNGELTTKHFVTHLGKIYLVPNSKNPVYKKIEINESHSFQVWGVVTQILTKPKSLFR